MSMEEAGADSIVLKVLFPIAPLTSEPTVTPSPFPLLHLLQRLLVVLVLTPWCSQLVQI